VSINQQNLATVRHNFANATFAHKVHEIAAERKEARSAKYKLANVAVVALVLGIFAFQSINNNFPVLNYIGAGVTAGEIVLLIISLTFNREPEITSHKNTALKYMNLRDRYRSLIADAISGNLSDADAGRKRDDLLHEYQVISDLALATTNHDYNKAMRALQLQPDSQNTWSDSQIDSLLPKALRKKA
jgi:hypothetical protein